MIRVTVRGRGSVIPCRLIVDPHECFNEISAVLDGYLVNFDFLCISRRPSAGREDPIELYYSLLLWYESVCIA